MNKELTNQIIRHVYNCLGVKLPNKNNKNYSILQDKFLLNRKVSFEDGDKKSVWGVNIKVEDEASLQILMADLSENSLPEFAMICRLTDSPAYGTYLSYQEYMSEEEESCLDRPFIAISVNEGSWSECNTYMQASFLCGMEKLKEISVPFSKIEDESMVDSLIKFIEFYQDKMEIEDERQEV